LFAAAVGLYAHPSAFAKSVQRQHMNGKSRWRLASVKPYSAPQNDTWRIWVGRFSCSDGFKFGFGVLSQSFRESVQRS